jgi:alcohol dehydrogenase, propanol-preferring
LCAKATLSGYTVDGTFQQYAIGKAAHVARIPKDVSLEAVAPILCAGITVYKGLKESNARPGQTVAIVGAGGGLGSIACQYAKAMGLKVIAIDAGDDKRDAVKKLGAYEFVDFATSKDIVADVKNATPDGLGPHAVLLVAVNEKPFQQAADVSFFLLFASISFSIHLSLLCIFQEHTSDKALRKNSTSVPAVPL